MFRRSLKEDCKGVVDLGVVIMIGIVFAALMVIAFIIWTLNDQLTFNPLNDVSDNYNASIGNVTGGFDSAVNLILVAITIFILAIAIAALLLLRGRSQ